MGAKTSGMSENGKKRDMQKYCPAVLLLWSPFIFKVYECFLPFLLVLHIFLCFVVLTPINNCTEMKCQTIV